MRTLYGVFDRDRRSFVPDRASRLFFESKRAAILLREQFTDPDGVRPELSIVRIEEVSSDE